MFLLLILCVPIVSADTLQEDFESYNLGGLEPETKPGLNWYEYSEGADIGNVSLDNPISETQSFLFESPTTTDVSDKRSNFKLEIPATLSQIDFQVEGTLETSQFVALESSTPIRFLVVFYILCDEGPSGCDFNVKFDAADTVGQTLIDAEDLDFLFNVEMFIDWTNGTYNLFVDGIDDGWFPFLEIPEDFQRLRIGQYRADVPSELRFDNWTVYGATNATAEAILGDAADGIIQFAVDINFTSDAAQFIFGLLLFITMMAAVILPCFAFGKSNAIASGTSFFGMLTVLWLVSIEFWPDWIGIAAIILTASLIGMVTRRVALGIRDASNGASIVAGSLGYFIIAASLLAFSGYATETIQIPSNPNEQQGVNETENPEQTFVGAVTECIFTGGVFTFGLRGDCSQKTVSTTWKQITDIFGWVRAGFNFLFQLLTFQLPIPVIFNVMIVLPPAAALASYAIEIIRGK